IADNFPRSFTLAGSPFFFAPKAAYEIHRPGDLENVLLSVAAGGRYDVTFTMPEQPVKLTAGTGPDDPSILFTPGGKGEAPEAPDRLALFDPAAYGKPQRIAFDPSEGFDRELTMV